MDIVLYPKDKIMTEEIQKAIDDCFLSGGGRITLEDGLFLSGGLRLRSGCTLYLRSGTILKGTRNIEDYRVLERERLEPYNSDYDTSVLWTPAHNRKTPDHIIKAASSWNNALIRILDARNVSVIGEEGATIDGSNPYDPTGEGHYRGPHGISCHHSHDLRFEGYTIKNAGNWAHNSLNCQRISYKNVRVLGGHDGIHNSSCDDFTVEDCEFCTGDDCIAGFDNYGVVIRGCTLNSACSGMRFGGTNVLVENCRFYGPAKYFFRGSLSLEERIAGSATAKDGRTNMLALFTYYSDFTLKVRHTPGNIVIRNCTAENCDRFLHYDFTGTHVWQKNRPLSSIRFEGVRARGILLPINAYGDPSERLCLSLCDCEVSFSSPVDCAIRSGNFELIEIKNTNFENLCGAAVRCYGEAGELSVLHSNGFERECEITYEPFESRSI